MKFETVNIHDYPELVIKAKKGGILFGERTLMFIAKDRAENVLGCCGILLGKKTATLKCLYVLPDERKQGYGSVMVDFRQRFIRENYPEIRTLKANCTPASVGIYLFNGFKVEKEFKNGIKLMIYENILEGNRS